MTTSFTPEQLRPVPGLAPIIPGSNVRYIGATPPAGVADAAGIVNAVTGDDANVSWRIKGQLGPGRVHPKSDLECTD